MPRQDRVQRAAKKLLPRGWRDATTAFEQTKGNAIEAGKLLGLHRTAIYLLAKKLDVPLGKAWQRAQRDQEE